jgi:hypothetical protein
MDSTKKTSQKGQMLSLILAGSLASLLASLILALISNNHRRFDGWPAFLLILLAGFALTALIWRFLRVESPPRWLLGLTVATAVVHLSLGVIWFEILPIWGHGSGSERAGYVMGDAFARDVQAWKLASSDNPLTNAFVNQRKADQYGGVLFFSAAVYRYLSGPKHHPLLMLLVAAGFSALAIPFTWGFAKLAWGDAEARLAAWFLALYPEAALLGSSQMREAFMVTLAAAAMYGLLRYLRARPGGGRSWIRLAWVIIPLAICMPISPPLTAMVLAALLVTALALRASRIEAAPNQKVLWIALAALVVVGMAGLYLALKQFTPDGMVNPLVMLRWWFTKSAQFQGYVTENLSGWIQKALKPYPDWMKLPFLLGYGIVQPFLPAALVAGSESPIWQGIALWRSIGWTAMLALLIYAPLLAGRARDKRLLGLALSLLVWGVIAIAALRAGGDMWDNPRYRVTFASLQAALAAWAWLEHRRVGDPLFRRALLLVASLLGWFLPWYLRRYTPILWPVTDVFKTLGLGAASAALLIMWDWARSAPAPAPVSAEQPAEAVAPVLDHG